jgi:hypothetical protein
VPLRVASCEGYKAFSARTSLTLGRINVIFSKNNSGKTTLARLPSFLLASLSSSNFYSLGAPGLSFGTSFVDLASSEQVHPRITLALEWGTGSLGVTLQHVAGSDGVSDVVLIGVKFNDSSLELDLASLMDPRASLLTHLTKDQHSGLKRLGREFSSLSCFRSSRVPQTGSWSTNPGGRSLRWGRGQ